MVTSNLGAGAVARPRSNTRKRHAPTYRSRKYIGQPVHETIVSTKQLAEVLEPLIAQLDAEMRFSGMGNERDSGALEVLCSRAARIKGVTDDNMLRRLYAIRKGESRATRASVAEALLMALDVAIGDTEIVQVPAGKVAARERIDIWLELRGSEMSERDIEEMVEDLMEFTRLVIHGPDETTVTAIPQQQDEQLELEAA